MLHPLFRAAAAEQPHCHRIKPKHRQNLALPGLQKILCAPQWRLWILGCIAGRFVGRIAGRFAGCIVGPIVSAGYEYAQDVPDGKSKAQEFGQIQLGQYLQANAARPC